MRSPFLLSVAWSVLNGQRIRFFMTVAGIALSTVFIAFLASIYRGVSEGSVSYVASTQSDIWVLQRGTTNILRGFSLLTKAHGQLIAEIDGVEDLAPILFRLSTAMAGSRSVTIYLTGFEPEQSWGGPTSFTEGRTVRRTGELVLDAACARANRLSLGDTVAILDRSFCVVGLSSSTNMFVIQYAFAHIDDVRSLYGISDLVSAYLVRVKPGNSPQILSSVITAEIPGVDAFDGQRFLAANISEMESGFFPIVAVLFFIGSLILSVIIGLLLTMNIMERRTDLAVLLAIGGSRPFLFSFLLLQSTALATVALAIALPLYPLLANAVSIVFPIIEMRVLWSDTAAVIAVVFLFALSGTLVPARLLMNIYPAEAFQ